MNRLQKGSALVATLAVVGLIALLAVALYIGNPFGGGKPPIHVEGSDKQTLVGQALDKGQEPVCRNNLAQIRQSIHIYNMDGSGFPQTLQALKGLPSEMLACPLDKKPYLYDPQSGQVMCSFPAHRKF